ncbi:MAG: hypothetical protein ING01_19170 [Rhodobacter sp.]|nr:hypothetical protein [Rhodobacter sp.]MCA3471241.1 hypothetical protein [Rhodobacter sp.]
MTKFVIFSKDGKQVFETEFDSTGLGKLAEPKSFRLHETDRIGFEVIDPGGVEFDLWIGDRSLVQIDAKRGAARRMRRSVEWEATSWLDGAKGVTPVTLRGAEGVGILVQVNALVEPSKLTLAAYDRMFTEISGISVDLLLDILSKSRVSIAGRGMRDARPHVISARVELSRIKQFWVGFAPLLAAVLQAPALGDRRELRLRPLSHATAIDGKVLQRICATGTTPRRAIREGRPFPFVVTVPTFDTPEHRAVKGFLALLRARVKRGHDLAVAELALLRQYVAQHADSDTALQDFIKRREAPRHASLQFAKSEAERLLTDLSRHDAEFEGVRVQGSNARPFRQALDTPLFRSDPKYVRLASAMLGFLEQSAIVIEDGSDERAKPIETIFEQWAFFQIVSALRAAGLVCVSHRALFEPLTRNRFVIDLDRNAAVIFEATDGRRISLRYEPTILPKAAAKGVDTLYRGAANVPWTPDIVLEVFARDPSTKEDRLTYAVVIDAKYTRAHNLDEKLKNIEKYAGIRCSLTNLQIVRQVWVAAPVEPGLQPRDETILWSADGEVDANPNDVIFGTLGLDPANSEDTLQAAKSLVLGILSHASAFAARINAL